MGKRVALVADGNSYSATVRAVLPELDETTRTATVIFDLDPSSSSELTVGQIVRFEHPTVLRGIGLTVPHTALVKGTRGLWACYAVIELPNAKYESEPGYRLGQAERRDVEVLYLGEERVVVRGALSGGDRVVRTGTHRLVNGQWVTWRDD